MRRFVTGGADLVTLVLVFRNAARIIWLWWLWDECAHDVIVALGPIRVINICSFMYSFIIMIFAMRYYRCFAFVIIDVIAVL